MAEDDNEKFPVRPDVDPRSASTALVNTGESAAQSLARMTGKPPNEETYWCMGCGFVQDESDPSKVAYPKGMTLSFDEEEIEALGGDLTNYSGPCPICEYMTLVPMSKFDGETIRGTAQRNMEAEHRSAARVFIDEAKAAVANGSIFSGSMAGAADAADAEAGHAPPGYGDDLPEAGDVDDEELKPREQ